MFIKNFFASIFFLIYAKGKLKLLYLCKTTRLATKLKPSLVFLKKYLLWSDHHKAHVLFRECMDNHRRKSSEQKSTKYSWFMGFSERRMGKYHYHLFKKLIGSCGRRCIQVIQCKGKFTQYWIFLQFIYWSNKDLWCVP